MIVSINQPAYLPWLGYYNRIAQSDVHVVLDHVQFEKNSFTNRNKIRTKNGEQWLTVPVNTSGKFGDLAINKVEINSKTNWAKKHLSAIQQSYSKTPFYEQIFPEIEKFYLQEWRLLNDLLFEMNSFFLSYLKISTPVIKSSEMGLESIKSDLVLDICKITNASLYLSGTLGKNYLEEKKFSENGVEISYQEYKHPEYRQHLEGFVPFMATLDLIFNHGAESSAVVNKGFLLNK